MATIHSLPIETLDHIFDHLISCPAASLGTLTSALVCRAWRDPAQRALHAVVRLGAAAEARLWLDHSARARYRTTQLELSPLISAALALEVMDGCPNLVSLVDRVTVGGGYGVFASINAGAIKDLVLPHASTFPVDATHLPCRLRKIALTAVHGLSLPTLRLVLTPSAETLTTLSLPGLTQFFNSFSVNSLLALFDEVPFPNIRTLILEGATASYIAPILSAFTYLEVLEVYPSDMGNLAAIGANVAPSLKVLAFSGREAFASSFLGELVKVIKFKNLDGLQRIELPAVPASGFQGASGLALLDECKHRGILVYCRFGYLNRDMVGESIAPPSPRERETIARLLVGLGESCWSEDV